MVLRNEKLETTDENIIESGYCWTGYKFDTIANHSILYFWSTDIGWTLDLFRAQRFPSMEEATDEYQYLIKYSNYFLTPLQKMSQGTVYVKYNSISLIELSTLFQNVTLPSSITNDLKYTRQNILLKDFIPKEAIADLDIKEIAILHKLSDDDINDDVCMYEPSNIPF